ncbi:hypothetical protein HHI36_015360 [Cryptolaemus montrouzieri]|uniref:Protein quiver n=1 Tax=Cryptolaemus montrouzieri TaxID=559131 RepID=A0ABD2N5B8_9CUCU
MIVKKFFTVGVLWLLSVLNSGHSLICYSCSASLGHGSACENITDHLSDISHHECFYNNAVCALYKIEYGRDVMIYRSCKESGVCHALSKKFNTQYNRVLECQTCNEGDLCNAAEKEFASLFVLCIVLLIFLHCSH